MIHSRRLALAVTAVLALLAWAAPASATFPGENGRLAFERTQLFTVNPDGSGVTRLTPVGGLLAREPAYSPDGRLIAFDHAGGSPSGYGIWVMSNGGENPHQITRDPQTVANLDTYPFWSPNGNRIGFVRDRDIYVMVADGSGTPVNLTSAFANSAIDPEWSPRGDVIAFSDGGDIYVVRADASAAPVRIPTPVGNDRYPSWSPDGSLIAYATINEVRRTNVSGANNTLVRGGFREVWDIAWSPDGQQIAVVNDQGTNLQIHEELFVMDADGSNLNRVGVDTNINIDWGVAAPVVGETASAEVVSGRVLVGIPRKDGKGVNFVPIEEVREIPIGALLDTTKGTVSLTTARDRKGRVQRGKFSAGVFQVLQSRKRASKGLTELRLKGSAAKFKRCRAGGSGARASLSRRAIRRLRGSAKGRYRTRGRHSAATVRGTVWEIEDRCDGTLTKVKRGSVAVRDFRRKKTVIVRAGKSYLAKAPR